MHKAIITRLLIGLVATAMAFGAAEVRASIVLGQQDQLLDVEAYDDLQQWLEVESTADVGMMTPSLFDIDASPEHEPQRDTEPEELDDLLASSPLGMAPSNTSLSQVTGSGVGGSAIANNLEETTQDLFRATFWPESEVGLPRGPTFRWFRPPRNAS